MKIYIWENPDLDMWYIHLDLPNHIYQLRGKTSDLFTKTEITDGYGKKATVKLNNHCQLELFYQMKIYKFQLQIDNRQGDKQHCVLQALPMLSEML